MLLFFVVVVRYDQSVRHRSEPASPPVQEERRHIRPHGVRAPPGTLHLALQDQRESAGFYPTTATPPFTSPSYSTPPPAPVSLSEAPVLYFSHLHETAAGVSEPMPSGERFHTAGISFNFPYRELTVKST